MQWLVPDVPKKIQNKIDHERYIDQRERWASKSTENQLKDAVVASEALARMLKFPNRKVIDSNDLTDANSIRPRSREKISTENP